MSKALRKLAGQLTSAERIIEEMFQRKTRIRHGADELTRLVAAGRRRTAAQSFGHVDSFLLVLAADFDELILAAREELGIATPSISDHLARLEENGPWLEDLKVTDSRSWEVLPVEGGRFAQVSHEFRMMSTVTFSTEAVARKDSMRRDEGVLRKMRERYEERYPAPSDTPEP